MVIVMEVSSRHDYYHYSIMVSGCFTERSYWCIGMNQTDRRLNICLLNKTKPPWPSPSPSPPQQPIQRERFDISCIAFHFSQSYDVQQFYSFTLFIAPPTKEKERIVTDNIGVTTHTKFVYFFLFLVSRHLFTSMARLWVEEHGKRKKKKESRYLSLLHRYIISGHGHNGNEFTTQQRPWYLWIPLPSLCLCVPKATNA